MFPGTGTVTANPTPIRSLGVGLQHDAATGNDRNGLLLQSAPTPEWLIEQDPILVV
ncbi:hypothetical protein [Nitrolancea hollandica]|uniref:Uncharacterized protein n=1 Tax=Nitrolancea hollandica Lb TaxID=1129897 RepID=I4EE73_9BACT|nr:hypothetical protein [Nitrolancea hollandica]CCF82985.1 hypothetical protein NITHO_1740010 [Nitrolancea hollandica Lb]